MCKMGVMHIAIGKKNDPLPLASPPLPHTSRNLLISYVKQLQQEDIFNFGMETFMIICVCHLLLIVEDVIVNHNETSPML